MSGKKFLLLLVLLSYLAGSFTLGRLAINLNLEIKYLFLLVFIFAHLKMKEPFEIPKSKKIDIQLFILIVATYFGALLLSVFYSPNPKESFLQFIDASFIFILILFLLLGIRSFDKREFFGFISGVLVIAGIVFTLPVVSEVLAGGNRGYFSLGGPNVTTRFIFFALISSMYRSLITKKSIYIFCSLFFLMGIVFVGSRGGLVGAATSLFVVWFIKIVFSKWRIKREIRISFKKILLFGLAVGVFLSVYEDLYRVFLGRFIHTTFTSNGVYSAGRDTLYIQGVSMVKENPIIGSGIGSFNIKTGEIYPHNIVLEMMINMGILGVLFFLSFLVYSIYIIFKYRKTNEYLFSGLPFYMIMVQMFSGGLYDFRFYFFWLISLLIMKERTELSNVEETTLKQKSVKKKRKHSKKYKLVWR